MIDDDRKKVMNALRATYGPKEAKRIMALVDCPMGVWVEMFEEIGEAYDTVSSGEQVEAFNRGIETCENVVRRYLGFNERGGWSEMGFGLVLYSRRSHWDHNGLTG